MNIRFVTSLAGGVIVLAAVLWALSVPRLLGFNLYTGQYIYTLLALAVIVVFLRHPSLPAKPALSRWIDIGIIVVGAGAMLWVVSDFGQFLDDANYRDFDTTGVDFPFRWAVGRPEDLERRVIDGQEQWYLLPGKSGEVSGCIVMDEKPPVGTNFWWGGLIHEFVSVANNYIDRISVEVGAP